MNLKCTYLPNMMPNITPANVKRSNKFFSSISMNFLDFVDSQFAIFSILMMMMMILLLNIINNLKLQMQFLLTLNNSSLTRNLDLKLPRVKAIISFRRLQNIFQGDIKSNLWFTLLYKLFTSSLFISTKLATGQVVLSNIFWMSWFLYGSRIDRNWRDRFDLSVCLFVSLFSLIIGESR